MGKLQDAVKAWIAPDISKLNEAHALVLAQIAALERPVSVSPDEFVTKAVFDEFAQATQEAIDASALSTGDRQLLVRAAALITEVDNAPTNVAPETVYEMPEVAS